MRKFIALLLFTSQLHAALPIEDDAVFIRVIDSGSGLATITRMSGGHYMVYDAGHWNGKDETMQGIKDVMGTDTTIDLMVISHSDSDHLKAVPDILSKYTVRGNVKDGGDYEQLVDVFDERGIRTRTVKRNSREHRQLCGETPQLD